MPDSAILDLVNHPGHYARYTAYAGFDGMVLHAQLRRQTGQIDDLELRGPGQLDCDVTYTGLRRIMIADHALPPIAVYPASFYVFAGYDVGKFDVEYGAYSLILNYALDGRRAPPTLNQFLLFDSREEAAALLAAWEADPDPRKETFMPDEILKPHAVYRQVTRAKG